MKRILTMAASIAILLGGLEGKAQENPFFSEFKTPYQVPDFQKIKLEHYLPAYQEAIKQHDAEIAAIVNNKAKPTFENTIVALDNSGEMLGRVGSTFGNVMGTDGDKAMRDLAKQITPLTSKHYDDINFNEGLFKRVEAVYNNKKITSKLTTEQKMLLENTYKGFKRSGAGLPVDKIARLRQINGELSMLSLKFGDNNLAETNNFKLVLENPADLKGLPQSVVDAAALEAKKANLEGKWVFTLQKPSMIPFLQYSEKRDLRERLYKGYLNRGNNYNENDNKEVIKKILTLSKERANILGFETTADYILDDRMAKTPANVYNLLKQVWTPALAVAKRELADMQELAKSEGMNETLQSWDWWYYAEKVRKAKYDLDEEQLRPYFKLENVREGVFYVANKLYGLEFKKITNIPVPNQEQTEAFEVTEKGKHVGILYMDYHPRATKRVGAWCTSFRRQSNVDGKYITPVVSIVCNFSAPTADAPALLNADEVGTLFHEFGHGLHNLLSNVHYKGVAATQVKRDFVELPSQIMEHWAFEPEVLKVYAKHYKTGEVIPAQLIEKLDKSGKFNQGFTTVEYVAAATLDLDYYSQKDFSNLDINEFEKQSMANLGIIPQIAPRYRTTYFSHIWGGGYSAGYYSYMWAEVLDADAFEAFAEKGIFDQATAKSFRDNILSKGGSDEAMTLYKRFRGAEPNIQPLLKNRGLN
ncbi:M3 family metallopeptidase [Acetobacteroides hydrogenigenes]|uniref:Peptidyl-dipeptidase Dcp n=1 Tax=Acetobacteroides hydrogenigenes TaxID=979970 RepID=A0A4R2ERY2_9BACT|nr:M3 family metallopeptidase [Acetobacteroides hydrogenigenes]TCN70192.1 peptidyl-dipeptidase Dcp [Acetobacteroides hydrogenigenes]